MQAKLSADIARHPGRRGIEESPKNSGRGILLPQQTIRLNGYMMPGNFTARIDIQKKYDILALDKLNR